MLTCKNKAHKDMNCNVYVSVLFCDSRKAAGVAEVYEDRTWQNPEENEGQEWPSTRRVDREDEVQVDQSELSVGYHTTPVLLPRNTGRHLHSTFHMLWVL